MLISIHVERVCVSALYSGRALNLSVARALSNKIQMEYLLLHQGWIAARAQTGWIGPTGPPRKLRRKQYWFLFIFVGPWEKNAWDGPKWGQEDFLPTNPDLADILGDTDSDFENFHFLFLFWSEISRFPGSKISKFPGSQISKLPDSQISRFPDAAGAGRTLRSQPDPSPNAPRDRIGRKEPLLRQWFD